ncbi:MAG: DNA cytosine methyltransferase, partial [Desulfobulbus sp.]|nr:DNA cytosine methyltransferase [Desulfobulbus sp.]
MSAVFSDKIPVIDLFAGPGGLAEGFFAYRARGKRIFKIVLSIEKDRYAHSTLELRSFFRQFQEEKIPEEYYAYLRKEISRDMLFARYPVEAEAAKKEAWHAELGSDDLPADEVSERIRNVLGDAKEWVLIGGPPCQAYSTVGRSRNKGIEGYIPEKDKRHFLYREYLQTIASHWPSVFVMENVKGLLSAKINGSSIFNHILRDLHDPLAALRDTRSVPTTGYKYKIYSLGTPVSYPFDGSKSGFSPADFLVMSENYGIPQAR